MRVFVPPPCGAHPIHPLFYFKYAPEKRMGGLFRHNLPPNFFESGVDLVDSEGDAEIVVLPNNFLSMNAEARSYIERYASAAVRVVAFSCGDLTHDVLFDQRVAVVRLSVYRSSVGARDHVISTLVDDPGSASVELRTKQETPVVSFCGQAGYQRVSQWVRYAIKIAVYSVLEIFMKNSRARIVGVYWRRAALNACERSPLVATSFIRRRSFSGTEKTIELSPNEARRQFIANIEGSDFVLAPKGDGNYSNRFLEALALGRIPVLIDTDVVLPFEKDIDYARICVRVPMNCVKDIPKKIREFYDPLSEDEWRARQREARRVFEDYVRQDRCIERVLKQILSR